MRPNRRFGLLALGLSVLLGHGTVSVAGPTLIMPGTDYFATNRGLRAVIDVPADFIFPGSLACSIVVLLDRSPTSMLPANAFMQIDREAALNVDPLSCDSGAASLQEVSLESITPSDISSCIPLMLPASATFEINASGTGMATACDLNDTADLDYSMDVNADLLITQSLDPMNPIPLSLPGTMDLSGNWSDSNVPAGVSTGPELFPQGLFAMTLNATLLAMDVIAGVVKPANGEDLFSDGFDTIGPPLPP